MNSSHRKYDDLTVLKGIGSTRQQWLKEIDIYTLQDLTASSTSDIEIRLKEEGHNVSLDEIDRWQAQAYEYLGDIEPGLPAKFESKRTVSEASNVSAEAGVSSSVREIVEIKSKNTTNTPKGAEAWKPFASFVVEFQSHQVTGQAPERRTTAHHIESDRDETWPGLETEQLCRWILDQADPNIPQSVEETRPGEVDPAVTSPVTVDVTQVQAFQPPQTARSIALYRAGQPIPAFVNGGKFFALEVSFNLSGGADLEKKQVSYQAQFHAHNLSTGKNIHLGDTQPDNLAQGKLLYTATLPEATLPPGMYRLRILVMLQTKSAVPSYLEIPLFQAL